jgi:hypothetical protein
VLVVSPLTVTECDVVKLESRVVEAVYVVVRPYSICEVEGSFVVHEVVAVVTVVEEALAEMTGAELSTVTVMTDEVA